MCNSRVPSRKGPRQPGPASCQAGVSWNPEALVAFTFGVICWTSSALCHVVLAAVGPAINGLQDITRRSGLDPTWQGIPVLLLIVGFLVLAWLWIHLNGPVPLAGLILGILAIREIRQSRPHQQGQVFAVAGVILSALNLASSAVSLLIVAAMSRPEFWP